MLVWWASAISTDRDSIDLISRLDRSHFPFPSAISTDRDSIVSFHICSATRSISFRDSTDLISHFPFQCNFRWPRLDSIINLISQSMMTQNQGDSRTNKFGLLVRSHCVTMGVFSLNMFGIPAQNRRSQVPAVLTY